MNKFGALFVFAVAIALVHAQDATGPTAASQAPPLTTQAPTQGPTQGPTQAPTQGPTQAPTQGPTQAPTQGPTQGPTRAQPTTTETSNVTTTVAAMTTAEAQTTEAPSTIGTFNTSCVRMKMSAEFSVSYNATTESTSFYLPTDVDQTIGQCNTTGMQTVVLMFTTTDVTNGRVTFTFTEKDSTYMLSAITLTATVSGHDVNLTKTGLELFKTTQGQSYQCNSEQTVTFDDHDSVTLKDAQVQAFMDDSSAFGDAVECPQDSKTSNIVPIAVGASLAALVVIVLIAYLISRQRNKRGYESV